MILYTNYTKVVMPSPEPLSKTLHLHAAFPPVLDDDIDSIELALVQLHLSGTPAILSLKPTCRTSCFLIQQYVELMPEYLCFIGAPNSIHLTAPSEFYIELSSVRTISKLRGNTEDLMSTVIECDSEPLQVGVKRKVSN